MNTLAMEDRKTCLLDGARGIYIPQNFATNFDLKLWHCDESSNSWDSIIVLREGPEIADYDDAWQDILDNAYMIDEQKHKWTLEQDGDLFAVRDDYVDISELTELSDNDLHDRYDNMLDDVYPDCTIGGGSYLTSGALKEVDPTAYRCGFNDWLDSEVSEGIILEIEDGYYQAQ
jgi:hypothetical protein